MFMEIRNNSYDSVSGNAKFTSNSMPNYFLKALVICICLLGCMWQIASIIKLYFAYPTTVFVNVQNMEKLHYPELLFAIIIELLFKIIFTECIKKNQIYSLFN